MKKLFVVADVHSFYEEMIKALSEQGFDLDNPDHIFVSLGDLFDRGPAPLECLDFVNSFPAERKILIRGNHEDLLEECLTREAFFAHDIHNGTMDTVRMLAGQDGYELYQKDIHAFFASVRENQHLVEYLSSLRDYAEIGDYIFVHGWIPSRKKVPGRDWHVGDWKRARWYNGMEKWKVGARLADKTILCGHWHTSWGHSILEKHGTEFGDKADFSPFIAPGIIALDACTVCSHQVNCFVITNE